MAHDLTLILGGARSGKSSFAEAEVTAQPGPWHYMATAQAFDDEMRDRIAQHRADRAPGWITHEVPLTLADALRHVPHGAPVLVDCLTLWLTNHLLAEQDLPAQIADLHQALAARRGPVWLVANEVGLGIVPDNALARRFRDEAGRLNQRIAGQATRVRFIAAGLAMALKG
ncbi:MAG: bifunctional adenosylcobinamide kinase / adenosylcobinamide-phosphate guanylyltransferase CobP [Roseibaca calidilacus]|uniref:Bifunctional adenosylcobalamin biosynthesis protein n=1 Tax=Roseibaca calidilacus TaxID=1666912 RepID=A0A0P8A8M4_9RHOB|nr:bifunctional adenosylcobinamide kinase/adenosylcobinamide-phosphate guanylyltransferase [Roseibaca calidilacus]KPP90499.1 MAG: bifunctional adenosylcobinamide kinase / adenosylcobinamide-phosphate guanylyltransferase CobP [Roseibaca calidilacus]CUX83315.1 adenosylcobinamide kinase /adenosylcobinamide-phosphate guanylyltransferase [Roseibaca calidilacus]